jgi:hypothetical protein
MSTNAFLLSIAKASELLSKAEVRSHYNTIVNLPHNYVNQVRDLSYTQLWKKHNENFWYHVKFSDQSLILFLDDSFKFIMSPFSKMETLDEYECRIRQELFDNGYSLEEIEEYIEDIDVQYMSYIDTELTFGSYTPVRVDNHPEQYHASYHPMTHIHIGHDNESRIPLKKIMTPYAFAGFILATFYPKEWDRIRKEDKITEQDYRLLNDNLVSVPHYNQELWCTTEEELRFYLV